MDELMKWVYVAIIDGKGDNSDVGLYREYYDGTIVECPWPKDWPSHVTVGFLYSKGYIVRYA